MRRRPEVEFGSLDSLLATYFEKLPVEVIKILDVQIKNIKVFLPNMDLASKSLTIKKNSEISVETNFQILRQKKTFLLGSLLANLNLQSPLKLLTTGRLIFPSLTFSTSLSLNWQNVLSIKVNSRLKKKDLEILSRASLNLTKNRWSAWPQAEIFYPGLPFKKVLIRDCPLHISFKYRKPDLLKNECTVILNKLTKRLLPKFPESLYFKTKLEVPLLFQSSILTANPAISVTLKKSTLLAFDLYASIQSIIDMTNKKTIKTNIDSFRSELNMPKFEETVLFLKNSRWSVPTPLNILQGPIQLRLSGIPTDIQTKEFAAKALLKTDLKSPSQRLKTESNFDINLTAKKFRLGISGIVSLKDVKIQLPPISLRDPPSLMPDPRFKETKGKKENLLSNSKIFEITDLIIRTEDKPILLQANLVPNLPIVSDFESSRQFIWRRRLGGPWSISTQVESSDSEDSITTMIEWFKRF